MIKVMFIFLLTENFVNGLFSTDEIIVEVSNSIAEKYLTSCTILIRSNDTTNEEEEKTFRLAKMLSDSFVHSKTTKIVSFDEFINQITEVKTKRVFSNKCSRMLCIANGFDSNVKSELEKLSVSISMIGPIWITFLPEKTAEVDFLEKVNIPFDTLFLTAKIVNNTNVDISESYRVSKNYPIRNLKFGRWSLDSGLEVIDDRYLLYRRNDLEGIQFNVGSLENPPMTMFVNLPNGEYDLDGYFAWVWKELEKQLNFTSRYIKAPDLATGGFDGKRWYGLIGMIINGDIDLAVSEVTMTPDRGEVIDFLTPLFITRYQIFFKEPGLLIEWDAVLKPFRTEVWLVLLATYVGAAILLKIMHNVGLKLGLEDRSLRHEFKGYRICFVILSAFLMQGNPFLPKSSSCRIVVIACYVLSLFLTILYAGTLTSFIAVHKPYRPFDSLEEFVEDGTYTMEQIPATAGYTHFQNSTDTVLRQVFEKHFPKDEKNLPQSHKAALEHVCHRERVAHFGEIDVTGIPAKELKEEQGCRFLVLENPMGMVFLTDIVPKKSPYRRVFDFYLNKMNYQGILYRFEKRIVPEFQATDTFFKPAIGEEVVQMHLLLTAGIFIALIFLLLEIYNLRRTIKKEMRRFSLGFYSQ